MTTGAPLVALVGVEEQHGRLLRMFGDLARPTAPGDYAPVDALWAAAAEALERHLVAEDACIEQLADAAGAGGEEIARIRADHRMIRRAAAELGVLVQLHAASPGALDNFLALLATHVKLEKRYLYPVLAEEPLEEAPVSAVPIGVPLGAAAGALGGAALGPTAIVAGMSCGAIAGVAIAHSLDGDARGSDD